VAEQATEGAPHCLALARHDASAEMRRGLCLVVEPPSITPGRWQQQHAE
jgi:hypothetical protein